MSPPKFTVLPAASTSVNRQTLDNKKARLMPRFFFTGKRKRYFAFVTSWPTSPIFR